MSIKRKLYPKGNNKDLLSSRSGTGRTEIDLRGEFDDLIYGGSDSMAHGRKFLLRRMRRDDDNKLLKCACVSFLTNEPDTSESCPYCLGEGYYWDENWIIGYAQYIGADGGNANRVRGLSAGTVRVDYRIFYFRYDTEISYRDKIIELKLDTEGDPVVPYIRESIYKPSTINRLRSDNGRVEYITVYCREEDAIRIDD